MRRDVDGWSRRLDAFGPVSHSAFLTEPVDSIANPTAELEGAGSFFSFRGGRSMGNNAQRRKV